MESTTFASFGVVPDIGDFDFDLGSLDSFNDMDIDMESFNLIPDTNCSDPFGSLSFEQSLNLVDLKNVNTDMYSESNNSCFLDDFDVKETIKQDCMWSSFQDASRTNRPVNIRNRKYRGSHPDSSITTVSLTPPSSYINDHLRSFDTPLPSDDDSSCHSCSEEQLDVISPTTTISLPTPCTDCSRVMADSSSSDHCYTSTSAPAPWSNKTSASAPLTPPESSEDEDSSSQGGGCIKPVPPLLGGPRNLGLTEIENDRFNKVVKSILLKKSTINKNSTTQSVAGPKFTFSLTTKNKNSLLMKKPRQLKRVGRPRKNGVGGFQSSSIKENKQQQRLQRQQQQQQQQTEQQQHYKQKGRRRQDKEDVKRSESRRNGGQKSDHKEARDVHNQMERQREDGSQERF